MTPPEATDRPAQAKRPFPIPARYVPLAVVLLLSALMSLAFPGFFQQAIALPLSRLAVSLLRLYLAVPQNVLWGIAIAYAVYVALRSLSTDIPAWQPKRAEQRPGGRVGYLAQLVAAAESSAYARWQLVQEVETAVLTLHGGYAEAPDAVRQRIAAGDIELPEAVLALLEMSARLPNYRRFMELRKSDPNGELEALMRLDVMAVLAALDEPSGTQAEWV